MIFMPSQQAWWTVAGPKREDIRNSFEGRVKENGLHPAFIPYLKRQ